MEVVQGGKPKEVFDALMEHEMQVGVWGFHAGGGLGFDALMEHEMQVGAPWLRQGQGQGRRGQ